MQGTYKTLDFLHKIIHPVPWNILVYLAFTINDDSWLNVYSKQKIILITRNKVLLRTRLRNTNHYRRDRVYGIMSVFDEVHLERFRSAESLSYDRNKYVHEST